MSTVGVIIPLYNKEAFIRRAVDSVLSQAFEDFEMVLVDDGSTDSGPDIVRAFTDPRIKLVSQENAGPGAARNRGVNYGSYEILAFLDADDEWFDGYLERAVGYLEAHRECEAVVQGHVRGRERAGTDGLFDVFETSRGIWRMPPSISGADLKRTLNACHTSATVCRRRVFDRYDGFYSKNGCRWGEDAYLWLQVVLNHVLYIDRCPRSWYHIENSGLYHGGNRVLPPEPALTDSAQLWDNCPPEYRDTLHRYLRFQAKATIRRIAASGDFLLASALASSIDWVWSSPLDKIRAYLMCYNPKFRTRRYFPRLYRWLKRIGSRS